MLCRLEAGALALEQWVCYDVGQRKKEKDEAMISYVKGTLTEVLEDRIVVETGPIGLSVFVPGSVLDELPGIGSKVTVYTYFQVREDAMSLYGFLHKQDRDMFKQLIGVNGIGPKAALGILSVLRPDDLRLAIVSGDVKALTRAPGVGARTAQRLILDLKDKVTMDEVVERLAFSREEAANAGAGMAEAAKEAVQALVALGYSNMEASRAVGKVELTEDMDSEAVLKASLRHLSFL